MRSIVRLTLLTAIAMAVVVTGFWHRSVQVNATAWSSDAAVAYARNTSHGGQDSAAKSAVLTCTPPPAGMVSWWPGDGNTSDIQGSNNGSFIGTPSFTTGEVGQAFNLNGSDQYILIPDSPSLRPSSLTIDAWVNFNSLHPEHAQIIFSKSLGAANADSYVLWYQSGAFHAATCNNGTCGILDFPFSPTLGAWYHIAYTFDGSNDALYINGAQVATHPNTAVPEYDAHNVLIGADYPGDVNSTPIDFFDGKIDEVELYNRALSSTEVANIFNAGSAGKCRTCTPPPANMISWWPGNGNANDIQDGNNGTPQNGVTFPAAEVGQGFGLNGINQEVLIGNPANLQLQDFTIDAWIQRANSTVVSQNPAGPFQLAAILAYDTNGYGFGIHPDGTLILTKVGVSGTDSTGVKVADPNFHHVAVTKSGSTVTFYVDGVAATGTAGPYDPGFTFTSNAYIGEFGGGAGQFWGILDEVELFNRPLSQTEIAAIVNAGNAGKCCSIACPADVVAGTTQGQCAATVNYNTPAPPGSCSPTCSPASGSSFPVGITTVSCMTSAGTHCSFTVTVNDTQPPTVNCPTNIIKSTDPNACTAVAMFSATASDICSGTLTPTCVPPSGTAFSKGTTTVTCSATGSSNNTGSCSFTVTVNDSQAPTITCPSPVTHGTDLNQCAAVVTYNLPTVSDNCPNVGTPTCMPASGSTFQKGVTTVNCSVSDAANNTNSCSFTVTVNDTQNPTINCPANVTHGTDANVCTAAVTYNAPTVSDNCPGVGTPTCSPASGATFQKGVTTVSCSVSDAAGNPASCSFTVTVNDTQAPSITCPSPVTRGTDPNQCAAVITYIAPTVSDNCPNVGTPTCSPASGSTFQKGVTTVTCSVSDAANNTNSCSFTVTVNDTQAPTVTCPAPINKSTDPNQCSAVVTYTTSTANDNCPGATVACSPASGSTFPKGTTTVTCTARDTSNNTGACTFTVTVNDMQPPSITCPANVRAAGTAPTVVNYPQPTASDNCPGVMASCAPASGSSFPVGTTTVTCTATDTSKNPASCTFTVSVVPCSITCPGDQTAVTGPGATQCGAVVSYPAPTATQGCGTVTCIPTSGTFFPVGMTTVTCSTSTGQSCQFKVTVTDNTPPVLNCPASIAAVAPLACPAGTRQTVSYTPPTATDNCPGAMVACVPPPGSVFAVGTTTVTCTATDAAGNTARCSFAMNVWTACLQDDSNPGNVCLFNAQTGQYQLCCNGMVVATGTGAVTVRGCVVAISHIKQERRVQLTADLSARRGSATIIINGQTTCTITDRDMSNDACQCPSGISVLRP